jgi:RNA polymerase sigma factor (sigma-70 family)
VEQQDQEILSGIRRGDSKVLGQLYRQHYPRIAQLVRTNSGTEDDARDLFQDAVMVLYAKLRDPGFVLTSSLFTYLYSVSRNLWLKKLRTLSRQGVTSTVEVESMAEVEDGSAGIEAAEYTREAQLQLYRRKFRELGEGCQELLRLSFTVKNVAELVERLGLSSELYARQRKFKCKEQLVRLIQGDPEYTRLRD